MFEDRALKLQEYFSRYLAETDRKSPNLDTRLVLTIWKEQDVLFNLQENQIRFQSVLDYV